MQLPHRNPARRTGTFPLALLLGSTLGLLTSAFAAEAPSLTLHRPDGQTEAVNRFAELPTHLAKSTAAGNWRLEVRGENMLRGGVHLTLAAGQRLVIEGSGPEAGFELAEVPPDQAAIYLDAGSFEMHGLTLRHGPHWCIEVARGVPYHLAQLHVLDARGGGIAVWGPLGVDQDGPTNNVIEHCLIERFNTVGAKWQNDGISLRDNQARVSANVVRDSPTETMGIRVMGAGNYIDGNLIQNVSVRDSGAIYLWGGEGIYTAVGNFVRHNVIVGAECGIYLDDGTSAAQVGKNYLIDCRGAALYVGGGRDNSVRENVALRCPVFARLDNRRTGWPTLPEKAKIFSSARVRLKKALARKSVRDRLAAGGLDVKAFGNLSEADFNRPEGNRISGNVLMPPAEELKWQNYARPYEPLTGKAADPALPNRQLPASVTDWQQLSAQAVGIQNMPDVAEILKGVGIP
jgi:hypothetical protein